MEIILKSVKSIRSKIVIYANALVHFMTFREDTLKLLLKSNRIHNKEISYIIQHILYV